MKFLTILMILCMCAVSADSFVTLDFKKQNLDSVIGAIAEVGGYGYAINASLGESREFTGKFVDVSVKDAVEMVCIVTNTKAIYKKKNIIIIEVPKIPAGIQTPFMMQKRMMPSMPPAMNGMKKMPFQWHEKEMNRSCPNGEYPDQHCQMNPPHSNFGNQMRKNSPDAHWNQKCGGECHDCNMECSDECGGECHDCDMEYSDECDGECHDCDIGCSDECGDECHDCDMGCSDECGGECHDCDMRCSDECEGLMNKNTRKYQNKRKSPAWKNTAGKVHQIFIKKLPEKNSKNSGCFNCAPGHNEENNIDVTVNYDKKTGKKIVLVKEKIHKKEPGKTTKNKNTNKRQRIKKETKKPAYTMENDVIKLRKRLQSLEIKFEKIEKYLFAKEFAARAKNAAAAKQPKKSYRQIPPVKNRRLKTATPDEVKVTKVSGKTAFVYAYGKIHKVSEGKSIPGGIKLIKADSKNKTAILYFPNLILRKVYSAK